MRTLRPSIARQQNDLAAIAHAHCWRDALVELKLNTLSVDELNQAVAVGACITTHAGMFRKLCAFGLRDIEDIRSAKTYQDGTVLLGDVFLGFFLGFPLNANDGSKNADTFLTLLYAAA